MNLRYQPVIKEGLPDWALEPQAEEDRYDRYWEEQFSYFEKGFTGSDGIWIPPAYYFYLNFVSVPVLKGKSLRYGTPIYFDSDHETFQRIWENEASENKGANNLVWAKARGKHFTFNVLLGQLLYDFVTDHSNDIAAGYPDDDRKKKANNLFYNTYLKLPQPLKAQLLSPNSEDVLGKALHAEGSNDIHTLNNIHFATLNKRPGAFRMLRLKRVLIDEAGLYNNLESAVNATLDCVRIGDYQYGQIIIGGTSDAIDNSCTDYRVIYFNPRPYHAVSYFIPANKIMHPYISYETGKSEVKKAEQVILKKSAELKNTNLKAYYYYKQENPLRDVEAFLGYNATEFDLDKMNAQLEKLYREDALKEMVRHGNLVEEMDLFNKPTGNIILEESPQGRWKLIAFPKPELPGLDVGGVDEVFKDHAPQSDSKCAIIIYRRYTYLNIPCEMPICMYHFRPHSRNAFLKDALLTARYFKAKLLFEIHDDLPIKFFAENQALQWLKEQPAKEEDKFIKRKLRYGVPMKEPQNAIVKYLLNKYIDEDKVDKLYFPELIEELKLYGTRNTDLAKAFGIALMADNDMKETVVVQEKEIQLQKKTLVFVNENGKVIPKMNPGNSQTNGIRKLFSWQEGMGGNSKI